MQQPVLISHPSVHLKSFVLDFCFFILNQSFCWSNSARKRKRKAQLCCWKSFSYSIPLATWVLLSSSDFLSDTRCTNIKVIHQSFLEKNRTMIPIFEDFQDNFLQHRKRTFLSEMSVIKTWTCSCLCGPSLQLQLQPLLDVGDRPRCQMMPCCTPTSSYITRWEAALTRESTHTPLHTYMSANSGVATLCRACTHAHAHTHTDMHTCRLRWSQKSRITWFN